MSQFIMCYSHKDLSIFGCNRLSSNVANKQIFDRVANNLLKEIEMDNVWIMEGVDNYFLKAQKDVFNGKKFKSTCLYKLLDKICDICHIIIFWYGSEFEDLDIITDKDKMFLYIQESIKDSMCECYLIYKNI